MFSLQCDTRTSHVWKPKIDLQQNMIYRIQPCKPASARCCDRSRSIDRPLPRTGWKSCRCTATAATPHKSVLHEFELRFVFLTWLVLWQAVAVLFFRLHRNILTISINHWPSSIRAAIFNTREAPATSTAWYIDALAERFLRCFSFSLTLLTHCINILLLVFASP